MYAIAASGKTCIVETQAELNKNIAIYPYASWHYCKTREEALEWLRLDRRGAFGVRPYMFGSTTEQGVLLVRYFISDNTILYNLDTSRLGHIRIVPNPDGDILVDNRAEMIKVKVNTNLDNNKIAHHCIAVKRLLMILGEYCDVCFTLPDMSVYIALTKYRGKDALIRRVQDFILQRQGGVSYTVDNIYNRCI